MQDEQITANFRMSEFERASHRDLTERERQKARWWAKTVLQPAREAFNEPIHITSYVRTPPNVGAGSHADGSGVDIDRIGPASGITELAEWLAWGYLPNCVLVQVLDERNHVHLSRCLVDGADPGYLREYVEGEWEYVEPQPPGCRSPRVCPRVNVPALMIVGLMAGALAYRLI